MAKDLLVGSTGFGGGQPGGKTCVCRGMPFHRYCRAVRCQAGSVRVRPGVPPAMFLANADPDADLAVMAAARENLRQIAPKQLVLISSIAVYADSRGKDEQSPMTPDGLPAYGRNRLQLDDGCGRLPQWR